MLGAKVAAYTVWEILKEAGIEPSPDRASSTWADFLRSQADALLACDFFGTVALSGARHCAFAVIEHANRRSRILDATENPTGPWVVQAAKNLIMDIEDSGCRARYLIRDRDGKFPQLFGNVLRDAGIKVVLSGVRMPQTRTAGPHTGLGPAPPPARPARVRDVLQRAPAAPVHRQRPPAAPCTARKVIAAAERWCPWLSAVTGMLT